MALSEMIESMNSVFKFTSKLWADNKVDDKRKITKEVFLFNCFAKNLNLVLPIKNIAVMLTNKSKYPAYVINVPQKSLLTDKTVPLSSGSKEA